jgi:phage tail sheath protein FI
MPSTLSYPGVYIEEIPSGVRTITGVATSITAFIGTAPKGTPNLPVSLTSFADYEQEFGALTPDSPLGYAVKDFYLNGGNQALVVRATGTGAAKATGSKNGLDLEAVSEGEWGTRLRFRVEPLGPDKTASDPPTITANNAENDKAAADLGTGLTHANLFNLLIHDTQTGQTEQLPHLTLKDSSRRADQVLSKQSSLARFDGVPSPTATVPAIHAGSLSDIDVWTDDTKSTPFQSGSPATAVTRQNYLDAMNALDHVDLFNLLCVLPFRLGQDAPDIWSEAAAFCERKRAFLIIDPQQAWTKTTATSGVADRSKNAAVFFPLMERADPRDPAATVGFVPSGAVAGVMARTDTERGVWKAPAGTDARLVGSEKLQVPLNDLEHGALNIKGVNCLRTFPAFGRVVWGARTLQGDDRIGSEWKYIPIRRLALFLEESLYRGTQWVVFEPNDEPLWAQIRLNVGAFMQGLFRQGAFQGSSARDAYFVKFDKETTTQADINLGIVNVVVGFAPLKPAEFVVVKIQQMAGQIQV